MARRLSERFHLLVAKARQDVNLGIVFDPRKHPRDFRGRFREVADTVDTVMDTFRDSTDAFGDIELPRGYRAHVGPRSPEGPTFDVEDDRGRQIATGLTDPLDVSTVVVEDLAHKEDMGVAGVIPPDEDFEDVQRRLPTPETRGPLG